MIGCGKMGEILAAGIVRSGYRSADQVYVSDVSAPRVREVTAKHGLNPARDNLEAVKSGGTVVVAVKPGDMDSVLREIAPALSSDHLVISVAAGLTTEFIQQRIPPETAVVRVMPNAAAQVGEGMAAVSPGRNATEQHVEVARGLLSSVGRVVEVPESYMDAVTALSGSGPAYLALFVEAMIEAGVLAGLPRALATDLAIQTMVGTAALMREGKMQPSEIREAVTSPGGTTAMALLRLEQGGVRGAVLSAIQAATDRSKALAKEDRGKASQAQL